MTSYIRNKLDSLVAGFIKSISPSISIIPTEINLSTALSLIEESSLSQTINVETIISNIIEIWIDESISWIIKPIKYQLKCILFGNPYQQSYPNNETNDNTDNYPKTKIFTTNIICDNQYHFAFIDRYKTYDDLTNDCNFLYQVSAFDKDDIIIDKSQWRGCSHVHPGPEGPRLHHISTNINHFQIASYFKNTLSVDGDSMNMDQFLAKMAKHHVNLYSELNFKRLWYYIKFKKTANNKSHSDAIETITVNDFYDYIIWNVFFSGHAFVKLQQELTNAIDPPPPSFGTPVPQIPDFAAPPIAPYNSLPPRSKMHRINVLRDTRQSEVRLNIEDRLDLLICGFIENYDNKDIPDDIKKLMNKWLSFDSEHESLITYNHMKHEEREAGNMTNIDGHLFEIWTNKCISWLLDIQYYRFDIIPLSLTLNESEELYIQKLHETEPYQSFRYDQNDTFIYDKNGICVSFIEYKARDDRMNFIFRFNAMDGNDNILIQTRWDLCKAGSLFFLQLPANPQLSSHVDTYFHTKVSNDQSNVGIEEWLNSLKLNEIIYSENDTLLSKRIFYYIQFMHQTQDSTAKLTKTQFHNFMIKMYFLGNDYEPIRMGLANKIMLGGPLFLNSTPPILQ